MTPKKTETTVKGRRPTLDECLMGWFRAEGNGGPVKGVKLGLANGTPKPLEASAYDWHCWNLVGKALSDLGRAGYETIGIARLLHHRCIGSRWDEERKVTILGKVDGYKLFTLMAAPKVGLSQGSDQQSDVELHALLRLAWYAIRIAIQTAIDREEAFVEAPNVEIA